MPDYQMVFIDRISVGTRMRDVDPDIVKRLKGSIEQIGLQNPISVWAHPDGSTAVLVAGLHRYAASKELGHKEVMCCFVDMDEMEQKLWEIAENLHRAELTQDERREHIAMWIKLTEEKLQSHHDGGIESKRADGKGHRPEGGIEAAARELGIAPTTAHRAVKAESLPADAKAIADEAGLGTVARAKAASKMDPVAAVREMAASPPKRAAPSLLEKMRTLYNEASRNERLAFLADCAGMDSEDFVAQHPWFT